MDVSVTAVFKGNPQGIRGQKLCNIILVRLCPNKAFVSRKWSWLLRHSHIIEWFYFAWVMYVGQSQYIIFFFVTNRTKPHEFTGNDVIVSTTWIIWCCFWVGKISKAATRPYLWQLDCKVMLMVILSSGHQGWPHHSQSSGYSTNQSLLVDQPVTQDLVDQPITLDDLIWHFLCRCVSLTTSLATIQKLKLVGNRQSDYSWQWVGHNDIETPVNTRETTSVAVMVTDTTNILYIIG